MKKRQFSRKQTEIPCDLNEVYFGYSSLGDRTSLTSIMGLDADPICTVQPIEDNRLLEACKAAGYECNKGDWMLCKNHNDDLLLLDTFPSMDDAFNHAYKNLGVERFLSSPMSMPE